MAPASVQLADQKIKQMVTQYQAFYMPEASWYIYIYIFHFFFFFCGFQLIDIFCLHIFLLILSNCHIDIRQELVDKSSIICYIYIYIYIYILIYPFTGPATNHGPENGPNHLRIMESPNVHIISLQLVTHCFYATEY